MRNRLLLLCEAVFLLAGISSLLADQVDMQNGDRYFGQVLNVTPDTVTIKSEMLGKITVPRKLVSSRILGTTNAIINAPVAANVVNGTPPPAKLPVVATTTLPLVGQPNADANLSAAFKNTGANGTNFIGQIRDQMLAGSPEAAGKYDEMVKGLMNGSLNVNDIRRQARASADQIRQLKQQLGPDADESLDAYLQVLDNFLKETDDGSAGGVSTTSGKTVNP